MAGQGSRRPRLGQGQPQSVEVPIQDEVIQPVAEQPALEEDAQPSRDADMAEAESGELEDIDSKGLVMATAQPVPFQYTVEYCQMIDKLPNVKLKKSFSGENPEYFDEFKDHVNLAAANAGYSNLLVEKLNSLPIAELKNPIWEWMA